MQRLTRRRLLQFIFPALIVWAYSIAVGADASVVRAALMFTFAGVATILFRQSSSLNALGGAALVLAGSQSERDLRSVVSTDVSVGARDRCDRMAVAVEACRQLAHGIRRARRLIRPCARVDSKTICELLFWSEQKVDTGTRALTARIPPVQSERWRHGWSDITCSDVCVTCLALSSCRQVCNWCCCR